MDTASVVSKIRGSEVEWIDLHFTDLAGYLRHVTIHASLVTEDAIKRGLGKLDGSSVKGFSDIHESDLVLRPLEETFALIPWSKGLARFICAVHSPDGSRFPRDPRWIAERAEQYLAEQGLRALVAAELEFFIFDSVKVSIQPTKQCYEIVSSEIEGTNFFNRVKEGYYVPTPHDKYLDLRMEICDHLRKYFGIPTTVAHHEVAAAGQAEINYEADSPARSADAVQTIKFVVKNVSWKHGLTATFMPKPIAGDNGSGMHVHVSIWRGSENLFYDPSDEYAELSQFARYFIGGLIEHGRALSAIVSPTINSYRRLIPGYEAPVYLVWSRANRSAAIRVPYYFKRDEPSKKRIEFRPPDPSANPYLAFAAIIMAGMDGVKKAIDPGSPIDENVYRLDDSVRKAMGIRTVPRSLEEALDELESDNEWLKPVFPREVIETYIEMKRLECKRFAQAVSPIELFMYLDV
ncbi:MAG: type I glutamate--ammonia ligase [Crenarchaeota archaeon]|nr:type I glutamate--ammonia ligase [Thermoproteota archaeon]